MPVVNTVPNREFSSIKNSQPLDQYHDTKNGKKFILYHTNWATYGRDYQVKDLPIDYIPEISYAFFNVDPNGNIISGDTWADFDKRFIDPERGISPLDDWASNNTYYGNLGQFRKLKESGKKFNLTLSLGGWSWSKYFSRAVNSSNRTNFVNNMINILTKYPIFCGISIDWEYFTNDNINHGNQGNESRDQDCINLIETIKLLKFRLESLNKSHYKISVCCSANPQMITLSDLFNVCQVADELHVMTYDFSDYNFSRPISSHHTNLKKCEYSNFSIEETVDALLKAGIKSTKIFIGVAFYSRGFGGTDGPGKISTQPSPDKSWESGIVDYKSLPLQGAIEYWDSKCMAPFSYDNSKRIYNSYDNVNSVYYKSRYVLEKNLGGILVWESSGDKPINDNRSLISALYKYLIQEEKTEPALPKIWGQPLPTPVNPVPVQPLPTPVNPVPVQPLPTPVNPVPVQPETPTLFYFWKTATLYKVDDIVIYEGLFYKCLKLHTSTQELSPDTKNNLWVYIQSQLKTPPEKCKCDCDEKIINHLNKMKINVSISFDKNLENK
jgi:chitinase